MKFLAITLIVHAPDPVTGERKPTNERFREVLDNALLAEELGFDGFGVGERHERPFISSSPPVVLSHIAALTSRIRLFTAVTTLSLLDPVRAYEDYATLDHLSGGRLELIIGKGNGTAQRELFHVTPEDQWDRNAESYEVFRQLWRQDKVTAATRFRPELSEAEVWPRPFQQPIRVWHGSATSKESVDLAARYGDPLFSANVTNPIEPYAELIRHYRERWEYYGHDPARIAVGAGSAGYYAARTSQEAIAAYRPVFEGQLAFQKRLGLEPVFTTLDDFVERSSALIGSPQQVIEKVHRYHEQFGHTVLHVQADANGLTGAQHRDSLELFQSDIAPVLRREIPDPPFAWGPVFAEPSGGTSGWTTTDTSRPVSGPTVTDGSEPGPGVAVTATPEPASGATVADGSEPASDAAVAVAPEPASASDAAVAVAPEPASASGVGVAVAPEPGPGPTATDAPEPAPGPAATDASGPAFGPANTDASAEASVPVPVPEPADR